MTPHFVLFPARTDSIRAAIGRLFLADIGASVALPPTRLPTWELAVSKHGGATVVAVRVLVDGVPRFGLSDTCADAVFDDTLDGLLTMLYLSAVMHASRTIHVNTGEHGLKPLNEVTMETAVPS